MFHWSQQAISPGRGAVALPRDLDRMRPVSARSVGAAPEMDGLTRGLVLGVPVSALLWLFTAFVIAKLIG